MVSTKFSGKFSGKFSTKFSGRFSGLQCFFVRAVPTGLVGAVFLGLLAGCAETESERQPDNAAAEANCAQGGRADDIVRKTAMAEFAEFGKSCQLYELATFPQNERETVWRVCCGGAALNYIFFPSKCVARRASALIQCNN
jgi:hypothetical protein